MARLVEWMDMSEIGSANDMKTYGFFFNGSGAVVASSTPFTDTFGNHGDYYLQNSTTSEGCFIRSRLLLSPVSTFYAKFHFRAQGSSPYNSTPFFGWYSGGTRLGYLMLDSLGRVVLVSGSTTLATSTRTISQTTWYNLELKIVIGDAAAYELRIDGSSVGWFSGTGDTKPGAETTVDNWVLANGSAPAIPSVYLYDDMVFDDADWVGDGIVTLLSPTSDGFHTGLTPSTGSTHYTLVDEIPASDSDYNETTTGGSTDSYGMEDLPADAESVKSVRVAAKVVKGGESIPNGYLLIRQGGSDYFASAQNLPDTSAYITDIWETDPDTSAAWDVAGVNSMEVGVKFDA